MGDAIRRFRIEDKRTAGDEPWSGGPVRELKAQVAINAGRRTRSDFLDAVCEADDRSAARAAGTTTGNAIEPTAARAGASRQPRRTSPAPTTSEAVSTA